MQTVVITGASTGIGYASVVACISAGYRVIATARRHRDLDRLQALGAQAVQLELSDPGSVTEAVREIRLLSEGHIDALFNNAGYGLQVALEDVTWAALSHQMQVNTIAPVVLTNQLLDCLQPGSKLIFNSSALGEFVVPFRGPYCMSKFAMEAAADAYRLELEGLGISVHVIQPGPIEARFRTNALEALRRCLAGRQTRLNYQAHIQRLEAEAPSGGTEPAENVAALLVGIVQGRKRRPRYRVTRVAKFAAGAKWLLGHGFDRLARRATPVSEQVEPVRQPGG